MYKKLFILLVLAFNLVGCGKKVNYRTISDEELDSYLYTIKGNHKYRSYYKDILANGSRFAVLNYNALATKSFEEGDFDVTAFALDEAIKIIETVYANNPTAKKARSKFKSEEIKDFKGEPYERALIFLKRGVVYLIQHDYENARAMFESGLLQDSLAEDTEYVHDFSSLEYLSGWASMCNGDLDLAQRSFLAAKNLNKMLPPPHEDADLLFLANIGSGPKKFNDGKYGEILRFYNRLNEIQQSTQSIEYQINDRNVVAQEAENIYWQATTRGGRQVDSINEGKAVFKEKAEKFSKTMNTVATVANLASTLSDHSDLANVGALGSVLSVVSLITAGRTKPAADIRSMPTPGKLFIGSANSAVLQKNKINSGKYILYNSRKEQLDSSDINIVRIEKDSDSVYAKCGIIIVDHEVKS